MREFQIFSYKVIILWLLIFSSFTFALQHSTTVWAYGGHRFRNLERYTLGNNLQNVSNTADIKLTEVATIYANLSKTFFVVAVNNKSVIFAKTHVFVVRHVNCSVIPNSSVILRETAKKVVVKYLNLTWIVYIRWIREMREVTDALNETRVVAYSYFIAKVWQIRVYLFSAGFLGVVTGIKLRRYARKRKKSEKKLDEKTGMTFWDFLYRFRLYLLLIAIVIGSFVVFVVRGLSEDELIYVGTYCVLTIVSYLLAKVHSGFLLDLTYLRDGYIDIIELDLAEFETAAQQYITYASPLGPLVIKSPFIKSKDKLHSLLEVAFNTDLAFEIANFQKDWFSEYLRLKNVQDFEVTKELKREWLKLKKTLGLLGLEDKQNE